MKLDHYQCDDCGREMPKPITVEYTAFTGNPLDVNNPNTGYRTGHLCPKCAGIRLTQLFKNHSPEQVLQILGSVGLQENRPYHHKGD